MFSERSSGPIGSNEVGGTWAGEAAANDALYKTNASVCGRGIWPPNTRNVNGPNCMRHAWTSRHTGGIQVAMCDGSVTFLQDEIESAPAGLCSGIDGPFGVECVPAAFRGRVYQNIYLRDDGYAKHR